MAFAVAAVTPKTTTNIATAGALIELLNIDFFCFHDLDIAPEGKSLKEFNANVTGIAKIFEKHMAPWIGRFFADLERAEAAQFYRHVGTLGRLFIDIEAEAFALPA